jgi:hypothetical protein
MNSVISLFSMLLSLFGMGTSTVSQVNTMRMQMKPPAQAQTYTCPSGTTGQVQLMADGTYRVICVQGASQP